MLVTNDFPPKVGGIQTYLWELWRRLPPGEVTVITTDHEGAAAFDAAQAFPVIRLAVPVLLPTPRLLSTVRSVARDAGAGLVVVDPVLPVGWLGPRLGLPYAVVVHGAELTVPARLPVLDRMAARVLSGASAVIAAGSYPAAEARRLTGPGGPPVTVVPPGVDPSRFRPPGDRAALRARYGVPPDARVVVAVSRLVPRKGIDVVIRAVARLARTRPDLTMLVAGSGRDRPRLERIARRTRAPVRFLGRVPGERLAEVYGLADVFAMVCRNRWFGLEQEGFGIVFAEAAACGVPQVAGPSGGAPEAVSDGVTGFVVRRPRDVAEVAEAIALLVDDDRRRKAMGEAGRRRVTTELSYDRSAQLLAGALAGTGAERVG